MSVSGPFDQIMKDCYPHPGHRIKQWVVDMRRNMEWERATCPVVDVHVHQDNAGFDCEHSGTSVKWIDLGYVECDHCSAYQDELGKSPALVQWQAERAARPPVCEDRDKFSDEVQR